MISNNMNSGVIFLVLTSCLVSLTNCLVSKGSFDSTSLEWEFIGKFCFLKTSGRANFNFTLPIDHAGTLVTLYSEDQWKDGYNKNKTCTERAFSGSVANLTLIGRTKAVCSNDATNSSIFRCTLSNQFNESSDKWWFVALSRCKELVEDGQPKGLSISYSYEFLNGEDFFSKQFSADEMGILETSIFMFVAYAIVIGITALFSYLLLQRDLFHQTFKLFIAVVSFQFASFLFFICEYGQYGNSGEFTRGLAIIARICDATAHIMFLLLLILIAKGYTVTRPHLRKATIIKLVILFVAYFIAYVVTFCYSEIVFDPGVVNYFYGSPGGIALVVIKLAFGWAWFCYACIFTMKNFPNKRGFYIALHIYYSVWFWASPMVILICSYGMSLNVREKVGFIVQSSITLLGHAYFLGLTTPARANKHFPYHISANQIIDEARVKTETSPKITQSDSILTKIKRITVSSSNPDKKYQVDDITNAI